MMYQTLCSIVMVFLGVLYFSQGSSVTRIDDIVVEITADKFVCDKIVCPDFTERCVVTKKNDRYNATVLVRTDTCYAATNVVLKQSIMNERIDPSRKVNVKILTHRDGRTSTTNAQSSVSYDAVQYPVVYAGAIPYFNQYYG